MYYMLVRLSVCLNYIKGTIIIFIMFHGHCTCSRVIQCELTVLCVFSHFRETLSIFFEFIPMVVFLMALFGYLDILIIGKWLIHDASTADCAPSLLIG